MPDKTPTPEDISNALARHFIDGLIRGWQPVTPSTPPMPVSWTVELSNGRSFELNDATYAQAFCFGVASAHQAGRGHAFTPRGDACPECGSTGDVHARSFHR
jgi:hypothetical protein